ncbi:MAG: hypothetical protein V1662_05010, partial [Candidatus Omnitrophota bacterium]
MVRITSDSRRRHKHTHFKGRVINFSIQMEVQYKGKWSPVIRYDTAHGFAHRDFIHPDGRID